MNHLTSETLDALLVAAWNGDRAVLRRHLANYIPPLTATSPALAYQWQERLAEQDEPRRGACLGRYRYGTQLATAYEAEGVRGLVLALGRAAPDAIFRVRDPDQPSGYRDYDWRHCDLGVRIADGYEVAFYHLDDGTCRLDHAPETLGLEPVP